MNRFKLRCWGGGLLVVFAWLLGGCSSLVSESASAGAGILGGAIAGAVTENPGIAAGIGVGAQAVARAAVQYQQRKIRGEAQQEIAQIAGPLKVGQVKTWKTTPSLPLEPEEAGRVTVSRVISAGELDCKEIVVAIDRAHGDPLPVSGFYVASICRSGLQWAWAGAEPATERWGSLQ